MSPEVHCHWDVLRFFRRTLPQQQQQPSGRLIECIRDRDWDGVRHRATTHPWDAQYRTSGDESTPLHLVCLYRAPVEIVHSVLNAFPEAILASNAEEWTPLHVALLYGASEDTALLLIRSGGANAAARKNPMAGSPLHLACRHGVTIPVFQELLKANPDMATTSSFAKPAALLWYQYVSDAKSCPVVRKLRATGQVDVNDPSVVQLMKKLKLLLEAVTGRDSFLLIHEIVKHQIDMDLIHFLPIAVRVHPEQLCIRDDMGNLPLHIAVSSPPILRNHLARDPRFPTLDATNILIQMCPAAAAEYDCKGRWPLHLALCQGRRTWRTGIRDLVQAAPHVLLMRDIQSHLYPVLLAATHEADDGLESLDTIFELLQAWPPVVSALQ